MSRRYDDWRHQAEQENEITEEDRALLEHVLGDDRPPQGLHRKGYDRRRAEQELRERDREWDWYDEWAYGS